MNWAYLLVWNFLTPSLLSICQVLVVRNFGFGALVFSHFLIVFPDLVSWGAIGARTTESQIHRELASGDSFQRLLSFRF